MNRRQLPESSAITIPRWRHTAVMTRSSPSESRDTISGSPAMLMQWKSPGSFNWSTRPTQIHSRWKMARLSKL